MKKMLSRIKTGPADLLPQKFARTNVLGVPLRSSPVFILLFSLFIVTNLTANHASALTYSNSIDLEYTFNPSLDVSFNTNTGFIIEDLAPGNASYSNTVVITASSNNSDGYNLLASVGDSNDVNRNNNRLVNSNNVNYFESVATNADLELSALGENKWGYAIYNSDTSAWSNYNGLPAVGADRSNDLTLVSTDTAGDTEVMMRIGASATNTQVAGEFTNKINFFVTTNVVTYDYSITYNANNPSSTGTVTNMPNNILSASLNTGDTLQADGTIPVLNGYIFAGWCDGNVSGNVCSGNSYRASDYLKITNPIASDNTSSTINNLTLTAMWRPYMQNVDDWKDVMLAEIGSEAIAVDSRDGNEYWVAKLLDDHIWMTQNLDLDLSTSVALTSENTDLRGIDTTTGPYVNGYTNDNGIISWTPVNATITVSNNTCADWSDSQTVPYSCDRGVIVADGSNAYEGHKYAGNNYNWTAAIASNDSSSITSSTVNNVANNPRNSICPKGWRLPTIANNTTSPGTEAGSVNEFRRLNVLYNNDATKTAAGLMSAPLYMARSGSVSGSGTINNSGSLARYWSSTVVSGTSAYNLLFSASNVVTEYRTNRYSGFSVRCLARES